MPNKNFATLNPNALGPGLALDLGNLVVTTDQIGLDAGRSVLSTIPKAVGQVYAECYFYSQFRGDLSGLCAFGLAETDAPLDEMAGGASGKSYAFRPADGGIWNAGSEIDSGSTLAVAERRCLGLSVDFDRIGAPLATWYLEGSQIGYVDLPTDKFWVLIVSVGCGDQAAGDLSAFVNFGQRAFENQPAPIV
jgi:hypothetical protein